MTAQQLKNSILQMAVQGKLVPQDSADEPASVLLERIRAEKEKLIKEGKIKKEKNPSVIFRGSDNLPYEKVGKEVRCIADEIPFEIPDAWEWIHLQDVAHVNGGMAFKSVDFSQIGTRVIRISDFNENGFVNKKIVRHPYSEIYSPYLLEIKNIILCMTGGTVGKSLFIKELSEPMMTNQRVATIKIFGALEEYVNMVILSPMTQCVITDSKNSTNDNISMDTINKFWIPLPPLAEQKRIVAKIEELLPHIEEYGKAESKVSKLNAEFPEKLKKSILQWAIQGKLVPQNPDDEPASVLLERIRAEKAKLIKEGKIKKDKNESIIFRRDNSHYEKLNGIERCIDDEIPFEIPDSWEWVRLRNIFNVVSARRVHQADWRSSGIPFYRAREIALLAENGYVENELFIDEKLFQTFAKDGIPSVGDLMITAVGTLGKCYIVKEKDHFYYKDASVICFENFARISAEYIQNLLNSPYMVETIKSASTGTTVGTITMVKANEYLIPLPPLAEQQRIVEAIESVLKKLTI